MNTTLTKYLGILTLVVAAAGFSFAGPVSMEKNVAPVPAPSCDWTGFYIGLNAGVGEQQSWFTDRSDWESYATRSFAETAFVGGGQLGYNYQWQDLVFGIEADFSGSTADLKRTSIYGESTEEVAEYGGSPEGYTDRARIDFMGTVRGRLGISLLDNKALLYATAGGAYAHGKWDTYYSSGPYDHYYYGNYYDADWRGDDWRWGWVGGFGFEYALNCHWSLRGEGLYYWLGEDTTGVTGPKGSYYADPSNGYVYKYTFYDSFWTYRIGLDYKFTGFFGAH